MAISATHYELTNRLKPLLPIGGSMLQIGEANWYGDLDPASVGLTPAESLFDVAKEYYQQLFAPKRCAAIDFNGTPTAWRYDLNNQLPPLGQFDLVINHGTAEHIFNIAQVFASMHNACKVGGLMVHESPFTGWLDHGFYCLQPTLFYDLAATNGYEIISVNIQEIKARFIHTLASRNHMTEFLASGVPDNAMLFVVYRKAIEQPFKIPVQGYYGNTISHDGKMAWENLR